MMQYELKMQARQLTRVLRRREALQAAVLQHVKQGSLASIVQTQEEDLGVNAPEAL